MIIEKLSPTVSSLNNTFIKTYPKSLLMQLFYNKLSFCQDNSYIKKRTTSNDFVLKENINYDILFNSN